MKKNMRKDILITGFALFAVFFGSGNLIFPPQVGLLSGQYVPAAMAGLALTGILFPMMAVAAVGNTGYDLKDMMCHVTPWWHYFYMGIGLLAVIFGTIPRCGGVAYETGFEGIFGQLPVSARILFLLIFFGLSYYFAMNRSSVIDMIGKYLTPILLITLLAIILLALACCSLLAGLTAVPAVWVGLRRRSGVAAVVASVVLVCLLCQLLPLTYGRPALLAGCLFFFAVPAALAAADLIHTIESMEV